MKTAAWIVVCLSCSLSPVGAANDPAPFLPRVEFVNEPLALNTADLDRDGHLDLVMATSYDGLGEILYGRGDGTFEQGVDLGITWSYAAHVEDVDDDGWPDVILWDQNTNEPVLFRNLGQRRFVESSLTGGFSPTYMLSGYLDDDDNADLVITNAVLLGNGDGSFQTPLSVAGLPSALGDFTQNGFTDYVTTDLTFYEGNGDGTFTYVPPGTLVPIGGSNNYTQTLVGDLNGDEIPDLVAVGSAVEVLVGKAGGGFHPGLVYDVDDGAVDQGVISDIDGDGNPDVIVTACQSLPYLVVLLGAGDGTLAPPVNVGRSFLSFCSLTEGDFDEDGRNDIAVSNLSEGVELLLSGPDGLPTEPPPLPAFEVPDPPAPGSLGMADFDEDGVLDVVSHGVTMNRLSISPGNGDGTLQPGFSVGLPDAPGSIETMDLDQDGFADIAVALTSSDAVSLLFGNGDGTFDPPVNVTSILEPIALIAGDLDQDTDTDLIVLNDGQPVSGIQLLRKTGNRTFVADTMIIGGADPVGFDVGLLNDDTFLDIAVAYYGSDEIQVFFGIGGGSFAPAVRVSFESILWGPWDVEVTPSGVSVGDIDGDGLGDLVVPSRPGVYVAKGLENDQFADPILQVRGRADSANLVDLDRDSRLDILMTWHLLGFARGNGDGTFAAPIFSPLPRGNGSVATGDLDRNGLPDVALAGFRDLHVNLNRLPDWIRFASDKQTVVWSSLLGTLSYSIYRGELGDLVDANLDGLSDNSYGTCMNDVDPDLTDAIFIDIEQPAANDGFTYLRARITDQGASGIGETSAGQARWVALPCP